MKKTVKTILAIGAHPDDIELTCPGTLLKFKDKGYDLYFVIATNGENGFKIDHKPKAERVKIRYKEQMNAAKILGVKKVYFLNYKDGQLQNDDGLRAKLVMIIKDVRPEIIFTFDPANKLYESVNLNHKDHRNVGEAVFDSVFAAKNRYMFSGKPHRISKFYFFGPVKINHFENVTQYYNKILEIVKQHRSQYTAFDKISAWVTENMTKNTKKYKYSEKFRVVEVQPIKI